MADCDFGWLVVEIVYDRRPVLETEDLPGHKGVRRPTGISKAGSGHEDRFAFCVFRWHDAISTPAVSRASGAGLNYS